MRKLINEKQPDLQTLKECFEPDFEKGKLYWRNRPENHFKTKSGHKTWLARFAGKEAGTRHKDNQIYVGVSIDERRFLMPVHRVMYSLWKEKDINDLKCVIHKDTDYTNNSINNLFEGVH